MTYSVPLPAIQCQVEPNEIAFMLRMEKLVEKLLKSEKKGNDGIIRALVAIKSEIETSYNINFNVNYYFDEIGKELNKQGIKTPKKEFDIIKKLIKKCEKKHKHHAEYIKTKMFDDHYQFNFEDELLFYKMKHDKDKNENEEDKEEVILPAKLVFGVAATLCGLFLIALPISACKKLGEYTIGLGIATCVDSICSQVDEDNKKDHESED